MDCFHLIDSQVLYFDCSTQQMISFKECTQVHVCSSCSFQYACLNIKKTTSRPKVMDYLMKYVLETK